MAAGKFLVAVLLLGSSEAARQLRGNARNQGRQAFSDVTARDQRQRGGDDTPVDFGAVAGARPGNDGKRCIDKVEMIEETEYDDVVQCDHSYDKRCHTTYVTNYESQQEEECE